MDTPLLEQIGRILDEHCYGEVAQLELPPDDELEQDNRLMWLVGLCHLLNDDPESAAGFFSRCARLFPERASNHGFYGIALSQLGRDDEAERPRLHPAGFGQMRGGSRRATSSARTRTDLGGSVRVPERNGPPRRGPGDGRQSPRVPRTLGQGAGGQSRCGRSSGQLYTRSRSPRNRRSNSSQSTPRSSETSAGQTSG